MAHDGETRADASTAAYPTLEMAYARFEQSLRAKSPRTAETYRSALRRLSEYLRDRGAVVATMTTDQIDGQVLEDFYTWLLGIHGRDHRRTALVYVAGVRAFLGYLDRQMLLAPGVSFERMRSSVRALIGRVPYPTPRVDDAVAAVVHYVNTMPVPPRVGPLAQAHLAALRDRAILTTLYATALRRGELAALNRIDVADGRADEALVKGKGETERIVFFDDDARAAISAYLLARADSYRPLFLRHDDARGEPGRAGERYRLSGHAIWVIVKRYGALAGVELTTHHLRHLKARVLLNNGMSLSLLQDLLGHASPETTKRIYAQHSQAHLRQAVAQYSLSADVVARRAAPAIDAECEETPL